MAESGPERPPTAADLEAAIAALPAKKEALREAFDRLVSCSPYPLRFTWEGLDAHVSAIQSSLSRRLRQLQVLEAARPARAVSAPAETRSGENQQEEEEEVEQEVEVVEESDDEGDEEGDEEVEEEEVEEEEIEEEVVEDEEVQEESVEDAEDATIDEGEQEYDEEMQLTNEEDQSAKEEPKARGKVEEQNVDEEMVPKKEAEEEIGEKVHEESKEEQEAEESPHLEPGAKNAQVSLKEDMTQKQVQRAPASRSKDLTVVCACMDANMLVKLICCDRTALGKELPIAMRHAPDAAALVLRVVKLFLSRKKFKATRVWNNCICLIRCVPAATSKPSADTIEQAKQVAKDWKEMIYMLECPGDLELLDTWGLLYFLMSYKIVSEFDTSEIIHLFSMVPRHKQNKNTIALCKGLGITDRITDLIDYLIGKGQQLEVFHLAHVFNLLDKYPPLSLLKEYIEKAKQTAMEIRSKSLISAIPKEIENLWVAHHIAKQKITDSSQRGAIMVEIKTLLDGYAGKKKRLAKECTSYLKMQRKKCKKEEQELHKEQESLQQDQQSKA